MTEKREKHKSIKEKLSKRARQKTLISDKEFVQKEIEKFKFSRQRNDMITGEKYYIGKQEILQRDRTVIGQNGELEPVANLPNNRIVDNQYKKMVDQKNNYLLGKPITFRTEDEAYNLALKKVFHKQFQRLMKMVGEDSLNCGIGWLYVTYEEGELICKRFKPYEVIPGWVDADHTKLDYAIRIYEVEVYEGDTETIVEKVEVYDDNGVTYFERDGTALVPTEPYHENYYTMETDGTQIGYNWSKIPLIPFKYNSKEIPLIRMLKSLQDGINTITSNFLNQLEEDTRNTILVLVNYEGENLGEFRRNLATYGAIKVRSDDGGHGDVRTLQVEVNAENYQIILKQFKQAIIENAMGYDAKDDRMSGTPNQMNIQSMYSDIDLDANNMETEFQASLEQLMWFVDQDLCNRTQEDFSEVDIDIIFNRDMMMNESEIIQNCVSSLGLLSDETVLANHPWTTDVEMEQKRLNEQNTTNTTANYSTIFKE